MADSPIAASPNPSLPPPSPPRAHPIGFWFFLFGILLPASTLIIEVTLRMAGEVLFDPIPTGWHITAVAFVPLANTYLWYLLYRQRHHDRDRARLVNGLVLGITAFYAFLFMPLAPFGVMLVIFFGVGFLMLAPLIAFCVACNIHRYINRLSPVGDTRAFSGRYLTRFSIGAALLLLIGLEVPETITRIGLQMAASDTVATQQKGLTLLRAYGKEETMRRASYRAVSFERDIVGFVASWFFTDPVEHEEARTIYYRVTGRAFNTEPPPASVGREVLNQWDEEQGGSEVGGQVRGLALVQSELEGSLDANAAVSYTEWTMVFENTAQQNREARAQVKLPPGGVVSRVTLWIDGEPREAAFGKRRQVRQAYERVVRRNRDPLLVTTQGPDRVLVQCFPVLPGQRMQIRIGITAPLALLPDEKAWLALPHFSAHNFAIPEQMTHQIGIEAESELIVDTPALRVEQGESKRFSVRGALPNAALTSSAAAVRVVHPPSVAGVWSEDPHDDKRVILQERYRQATKFPSSLAVVVDGSASLKNNLSEIADLLPVLARHTELTFYLADDKATLIYNAQQHDLAAAQQRLRKYTAVGGRDNIPALLAAWQQMHDLPDEKAILWIHGPQPASFGDLESLKRRLSIPESPEVYEMQLGGGRNRLTERLGDVPSLRALHYLGDLEGDILRTLQGTVWAFRYSSVPATTARVYPRRKTSAHLARLWASDEVHRLLRAGAIEQATTLAVQYQLVTPLSGAVVLETQRQYQQAGLEPVEPGSVPTIPEPEMWALLAVGVLLLSFYAYRQRRYQVTHAGWVR